jgi:hypothetical protein
MLRFPPRSDTRAGFVIDKTKDNLPIQILVAAVLTHQPELWTCASTSIVLCASSATSVFLDAAVKVYIVVGFTLRRGAYQIL